MTDERLRELYALGVASGDGDRAGAHACELPPETLLALAAGEYGEEEALELLDRVMGCAACQAEFALLRAVVLAGRELEEGGVGAADAAAGRGAASAEVDAAAPAAPEAPRSPLTVERGGVPRPPRAAPAGRDADGRPAAAGRRPALRLGAPILLAATLLLAIGLSRWVTGGPEREPMRGASGALALVAPAEGAVRGDSLRFVWRSVEGAVRYRFELLDGGGLVLYETTTVDTALSLPGTVALRGGAEYRWLVRATDSAGTEHRSAVRRLRLR